MAASTQIYGEDAAKFQVGGALACPPRFGRTRCAPVPCRPVMAGCAGLWCAVLCCVFPPSQLKLRAPTKQQSQACSAAEETWRALSQVHPAPGPEEVNWQHLWLTWRQRDLRTVLTWPLILAVVVFPITGFTSAVARLQYVLCPISEGGRLAEKVGGLRGFGFSDAVARGTKTCRGPVPPLSPPQSSSAKPGLGLGAETLWPCLTPHNTVRNHPKPPTTPPAVLALVLHQPVAGGVPHPLPGHGLAALATAQPLAGHGAASPGLPSGPGGRGKPLPLPGHAHMWRAARHIRGERHHAGRLGT